MENTEFPLIILGSGSADRKSLLEYIGLPFKVVVSGFDENIGEDLPPEELVVRLARGKLESVRNIIKNDPELKDIVQTGNYVIITADTVVSLDNTVIGKAKDKRHAFTILKKLSGRTHRLITGAIFYWGKTGEKIVDVNITEVEFDTLEDDEIRDYLEGSDEYIGRAGAYSIRNRAAMLIKKIIGCPSNVIGLSMNSLYKALRKFGINPLRVPFYGIKKNTSKGGFGS